jgi:phage gpG-like protein
MNSGAEVDISEVLRELQRIERRATDLSDIMPVAAETLVGYVQEEWESAGRGRWPGLAPSTIAKRRMGGGAAQVLKDTGRSAASVQAFSGADFAEAATDVATMVYHVSDAPRTRIPLRNPFDVLDLAEPEITSMVARYIASGET